MIINSTFIDNAKYVFDYGVYLPIYCEEVTYDYGINCEYAYTIVSFEKNYNVTIINSTFNDNHRVPCIPITNGHFFKTAIFNVTNKTILRICMVCFNMQISYEVLAAGSNATNYFTAYFYAVYANMCLTKI